eukprot:CAMPEP_0181382850 /NCGR_PEP_ID=MMETSP1106-20121128/20991_1 /TAXON_ID=81844 /ORGANISM="Mantoniella antarctica, Strain SL-175" /LENGTH=208 /DNA_ID=CAMNT_0023502361 /DNA_START=127 /DNA_END=749 /DNA_ORIENTATION=+
MALAGLSAAADQLQIAREWAVLGDYDTARLYYQGVASQVARHMHAISSECAADPYRKGKWLSVKQQLVDELEAVSALERERGVFATLPGSAAAAAFARTSGGAGGATGSTGFGVIPPGSPIQGAGAGDHAARARCDREEDMWTRAAPALAMTGLEVATGPAAEDPDVWRPPSRDPASSGRLAPSGVGVGVAFPRRVPGVGGGGGGSGG